ncbi:MAG: SGNH/GDSL hydrolase family protein [Lentisphaerae bacterium]|nr:SGNH/GDSL hydrolase family protein [Lentisphaerota bacterium]
MNVLKKILMSLVMLLLFFLLLEGVLVLSKFDYELRRKTTYKPFIGMRFGTAIEHYPTDFDPPGYIWLMSKEYVSFEDPRLADFRFPTQKTPGKKLVAFLGGSTTQPDWLRAYPRRCIALLNQAVGEDVYESINCGMSSYTTHQSLIALKRYVLPLNPDYVVVFHGWNDPLVQTGYSDKETEKLFKSNISIDPDTGIVKTVYKLKTTKLLAMAIQKLDRSWPRPRVSMKEFDDNLSEMAEICKDRNIPLIIVERPLSLSEQHSDLGELATVHYSRIFGTNVHDIFLGIHANITNVQASVANRYPNTILAPACNALMKKQMEFKDNPVEGISLFILDNVHMDGLGNQFLAEVVAASLAPEIAEQIKALTESADYWTQLALEFTEMDSPRECYYAVTKARKIAGGTNPLLDAFANWSESTFVFSDYFEKYRWDNGSNIPLDERLEGLSKCLEIRPSDYGVMLQIFRVCLYLDTSARAISYLERFQPTNANDMYAWLKMCQDSFSAAGRHSEAVDAAKAILEFNPYDEDALHYLRSVRYQ